MGARVSHSYTEIVDGTGKKMYAAQTETVTADQLSVGDRVLAFGLEWTFTDCGRRTVMLKREDDDIYIDGIDLTFERIIPPKRYKRTEVLEYRVPVEGETYLRWYRLGKPADPKELETNTASECWPKSERYVITSVEVEEIP